MLWVRIYIHYLGGYVFLASVNLTPSTFNVQIHTVDM